MKTRRQRYLISFLLAALLAPATVHAARGPKEVIEDGTEKVRSILKKKTKDNSKEEQARKEQLKKIVDGFLDYYELSRRALGPHWDARKSEERAEFAQLLRDLIEASYTSAIRNNVDFVMNYEGEEIAEDGATANVSTVASAKNSKGKTVSEDLIFHLFLKDQAWMIFDVEFGDVSLVRHYRGEFNRKIKKESYEALLTAMRKKLDEIKSGKIKEKTIKL